LLTGVQKPCGTGRSDRRPEQVGGIDDRSELLVQMGERRVVALACAQLDVARPLAVECRRRVGYDYRLEAQVRSGPRGRRNAVIGRQPDEGEAFGTHPM